MRPARSATLLCALALGGCDVFDASLYQDLDGGHHHDAGDLLTLPLADRCTGDVPVVESSHEPRLTSTNGLSNTFDTDIAACTGAPEPGDDGFFQVEMEQGDKWHFHLRVRDSTANPALYILRSCDERACSSSSGLDECGTGRDEHLSFVAPSSGSYFVGVDSSVAGSATYEIEAVRPVCGNGGQPEHSETCDDGNTTPGDGCSEDCRSEVTAAAPSEIEPNDEATNANLAVLDGDGRVTVRGTLGGRCDFDMWALRVPDGAGLRATMLDTNGNPCPNGSVEFRVFMIHGDGNTIAGEGAATADNACPSFDASASFAHGLPGGTHYVRVTTVNDEPLAVGYRLALEVVQP